jgi:hypothetical protein
MCHVVKKSIDPRETPKHFAISSALAQVQYLPNV